MGEPRPRHSERLAWARSPRVKAEIGHVRGGVATAEAERGGRNWGAGPSSMPTWGATEPWRPERKRGPEEPRRRCLSPNIRPVRPPRSPGGGPPPRPAGSPQRCPPGPPLLSPRRQLWVIPWSWGAPLFSGRTLCTSCAPTSSRPVSLLPFGVQCLKGLIDAPLVTPFIHLFLNNFFCVLPGNPPHDSPRPRPSQVCSSQGRLDLHAAESLGPACPPPTGHTQAPAGLAAPTWLWGAALLAFCPSLPPSSVS